MHPCLQRARPPPRPAGCLGAQGSVGEETEWVPPLTQPQQVLGWNRVGARLSLPPIHSWSLGRNWSRPCPQPCAQTGEAACVPRDCTGSEAEA